MLRRLGGPAAAAAWAWLLVPLQPALALRSGHRAGLVQEPFALAWPEDPEKTAVAQGLNAKFEESFGHRVDEVCAHLKRAAVLTVSGYIERLFLNFLVNVQGAAVRSHTNITVVNAMLDQTSLETCRRMVGHGRVSRLWVHCIDLVGMLPSSAAEPKPKGGSFLWAKPVVFRRAVAASPHGVLLADIDVIFYKDLVSWVQQYWRKSPDVVLSTATEWGTCCNTGTVYAEKNRSMPLLDMWVEANHHWYQRKLGDQDALFELTFSNISTLNIANNFKLPYPEGSIVAGRFDKRIDLMNESIVNQQGRKCRGCASCRGPCKTGRVPYATHYNTINTHMQPEHFLRARGNWSGEVDEIATGSGDLKQMMIEGGDWCALDGLEGLLSIPEEGAGSTRDSARGGVLHRDAEDGLQH